MIDSAMRLLTPLFPTGLIELRAVKAGATGLVGRDFVSPGDTAAVQRFATKYREFEVYFGVAARRDKTSGDLKNCSFLNALFADLDFKLFASAEAAWEKLELFPLKPSCIVHSGGGLHCYWFLNEPINLQTHAAQAKSLLRRLALAIGADLGSAEPAHVLRVPGTLNHKYHPAQSVILQ